MRTPQLCAAIAIVALVAFEPRVDGAWADSQQHSKVGEKATGKQGSTTAANRMEKASGKQPHKKAPEYIEQSSTSFGAFRGSGNSGKKGSAGKGKAPAVNEINPPPK